jgi:hypothetical protein
VAPVRVFFTVPVAVAVFPLALVAVADPVAVFPLVVTVAEPVPPLLVVADFVCPTIVAPVTPSASTIARHNRLCLIPLSFCIHSQ